MYRKRTIFISFLFAIVIASALVIQPARAVSFDFNGKHFVPYTFIDPKNNLKNVGTINGWYGFLGMYWFGEEYKKNNVDLTGDYDDFDNDGTVNWLDEDKDGDGVMDLWDSDGEWSKPDDGSFPNAYATDLWGNRDDDGDGIANNMDTDIDGDGLANWDDPTPRGGGTAGETSLMLSAYVYPWVKLIILLGAAIAGAALLISIAWNLGKRADGVKG